MNTSDKGKRRGRGKNEDGRMKEEKMKRIRRKEGKKRKERKTMTWNVQIT